jgi:hypothetical protein
MSVHIAIQPKLEMGPYIWECLTDLWLDVGVKVLTISSLEG